MESYKEQKPLFSQSCDRLLVKILELLGDQEVSDGMEDQQAYDYWCNLRQS
jgi:hypothetical protein